MVTYGDMMGLVLTFFVLIVAYSAVDAQKARDALLSVQNALGSGVLEREFSSVELVPGSVPREGPGNAVEKAARELRQRLQVMGKAEDVQMELDEQGRLRIALPTQALFDTASAELHSEAYDVLGAVGDLLARFPDADIQVAGHTDNRPLKSTQLYRDNYELSFARAMAVSRYFSGEAGVPLEQLEIVAYGPNKPTATNDTDEGRQANRRVEIFVSGRMTPREVKEMRSRAAAIGESSAGAPQGS